VLSERTWLESELRRRDFAVLPSATNFLFCRPRSGAGAERLFLGLRERRVLVRHYDREPIQGWIRITIGTREQHQLMLSALDQLPG